MRLLALAALVCAVEAARSPGGGIANIGKNIGGNIGNIGKNIGNGGNAIIMNGNGGGGDKIPGIPAIDKLPGIPGIPAPVAPVYATKDPNTVALPPLTSDEKAAGEKLIDQFIGRFEANYQTYKTATETAAKELAALIDRTPAFIVPPEISSRTKAPASLRGKLIKAMDKGKLRPQNIQDVEAAAFDVIGMRITAFAPSIDLPVIEGLLNQSFVMKRWKRGDPNSDYPGNNYLGSASGVNIEIQTRGALDHAYLQVQHKTNYKPKPGYELTPAQLAMLKKFRSDVEAAKSSLATFIAAFRAAHPLQAQHAFKQEGLAQADTEVSASASAAVDSWSTHFSSTEEEIFEAASEHFDAFDEEHFEEGGAVEKSAFRRSNLLRINN